MNMPELRFKDENGQDYPSWSKINIEDLAVKVIDGDRGENYPNGNDFSNDGYCLFLNAKNVTKSGFAFDELSFISKEKDEKLRKGKLVRNDLVITTRGTVGNIAYFDESVKYENIRINSGMVIVRNESSDISSNYLYQYFYTPNLIKTIDSISFGSAQPQLTVGVINKIKIGIPVIQEQTKIAKSLTAVDEKIAQLTQKSELLARYKKGVMQQIFSQQLRFKDDDGRDFPEWEIKKLVDIADLTSSKRVYLSDYVNEGIPFYRGKEISELKRNEKPKDILYITREVYETFKSSFGVPQVNDILITAVGTLGNVYRIKNDTEFYFKDGNLIWLKSVKISSAFLEILLETNQEAIQKSSIGSSQRALTIVELKKLKFNIPILAEQTKIANFLTALDDKISQHQTQLNALKQYKQGLLQQMFV